MADILYKIQIFKDVVVVLLIPSSSSNQKMDVSKQKAQLNMVRRDLTGYIGNMATMQKTLRSTFSVLCLICCIQSCYRMSIVTESDISSYICDFFDAVVSIAVCIALQKAIVLHNVSYFVIGIISIVHFFLYTVFRVNVSNTEIKSVISRIKLYLVSRIGLKAEIIGSHFPLSTCIYFVVYACDYYIDSSCKNAVKNLIALSELEEKLDSIDGDVKKTK